MDIAIIIIIIFNIVTLKIITYKMTINTKSF